MTKLNAAQQNLLTLAAQADDGAVSPNPGSTATAAALLRRGMLISLPQAEGPSRLLITEAGRAQVGLPAKAPSPAPANSAVAPPEEPKGKIPALIALLGRPKGASVEAMMAETGLQAHSVRGALSGAIKKNRGLTVTSAKTDGVRIYRIVEGAVS